MKKYLIFFFLILFPLKVDGLSANSITLMDMDNNRVLYSHNQNDKRLIASISKIMTSIVVLNNSNINDIIKVDDSILKSYGSGIYIEVGEKISLEHLLYGLMLRSGNDAAIQLANSVGGSMDGFVKLMNETAKSLNMINTEFINSSGLEDNNGLGNMSTSYDMALLMSYAMKNDTFKKIVGTKEKTVKTNYKTYIWNNKNKLLKDYKYCTGGKTGYTKKAKRTLVTTASKDNMNFVIVTLNDPNDFSDHLNLYEEYFKRYKKYEVLNKNEKFKNENYYIKNSIYITLTKDEYKRLSKIINYYEKNVSDIVGYVSIKLDDTILAKEYIYEKNNKKNNNNVKKKIKDFLHINR